MVDESHIQQYIDFARRLPPPAAMRLVLNADDVNYMTCLCGHRKHKGTMPQRHSGIVPFKDTVCRGCTKAARGTATIVCSRCREVIGKIPPGKDKDGFTFVRDSVYHVVNCPNCCPEIESTEIVERILWLRRNSLPTPSS